MAASSGCQCSWEAVPQLQAEQSTQALHLLDSLQYCPRVCFHLTCSWCENFV